jgi:hypothetical protein
MEQMDFSLSSFDRCRELTSQGQGQKEGGATLFFSQSKKAQTPTPTSKTRRTGMGKRDKVPNVSSRAERISQWSYESLKVFKAIRIEEDHVRVQVK